MKEQVQKFPFKKGTKIVIGNDVLELTADCSIPFEGAGNEPLVVGILAHSGSLEINRPNLKFRYNGFGQILPIYEQVDDPAELDDFIVDLTEAEAFYFQMVERRNNIIAAREQEAADKKAADKAAKEAKKAAAKDGEAPTS